MRVVQKGIGAAVLAAVLAGCGESPTAPGASPAAEQRYVPTEREAGLAAPPAAVEQLPYEMSARRGRILFITKSCVICHAVNGVGGMAAPTLDVAETMLTVDPVGFSARMWKGAYAMAALQRIELGYQIALDGQDIADLAAFAVNREEQSLVSQSSLPRGLEAWFLNDRYWRDDTWSEYLGRGERIPDTSDFDQP